MNKKAYLFFLEESIKLQNKYNKLLNETSIVKAPIITDFINNVIEIDKEIKEISILKDNLSPIIVRSESFIKSNDNKFYYTLKLKEGYYKIIAYNKDDFESAPCCIYIKDELNKKQLLINEKNYQELHQEEVSLTAIKYGYYDDINKTSEYYPIYNNLQLENHASVNKLYEPYFIGNSDNAIQFSFKNLIPKKYFLCIDESKELNTNNLIFKIDIINQNVIYTLHKNKYLLLDGERYSAWIEDINGNVLTNIFNFTFNENENKLNQIYNELKIDLIISLYNKKENQLNIQSYRSENMLINYSEIINSVILNAFNITISNNQRKDIIIDSIEGKDKYYYKSLSKIDNVTIKLKENSINIISQLENVTHIIIESYYEDDFNIITKTYDMDFKLNMVKDYKGIVVYFCNLNNQTYSYPIIFDKTNLLIETKNTNCEVII